MKSIRGIIKQRVAFLNQKGKESVKEDNQADAVITMALVNEYKWLLNQIKKR